VDSIDNQDKKWEKIAVIVPAYNESKSLDQLLRQIIENIRCQIIVTNDGSDDNTVSVVEQVIKEKANVHLLNHVINIGPFVAVQTGVKFATRLGCEYFIQVDGDGQHPPDQITKVLEPVLKGEADLVIGSRYLNETDYETSFTRRTGIQSGSKILSSLCNVKITDVNSGFRAFNRKFAQEIIKEYLSINNIFEFTFKICKKGYRVKEVSIPMESRKFGSSYFTSKRLFLYPFRLTYSLIRAIL